MCCRTLAPRWDESLEIYSDMSKRWPSSVATPGAVVRTYHRSGTTCPPVRFAKHALSPKRAGVSGRGGRKGRRSMTSIIAEASSRHGCNNACAALTGSGRAPAQGRDLLRMFIADPLSSQNHPILLQASVVSRRPPGHVARPMFLGHDRVLGKTC